MEMMASKNDSIFKYSLETHRLAADWCPCSWSDNPLDNPYFIDLLNNGCIEPDTNFNVFDWIYWGTEGLGPCTCACTWCSLWCTASGGSDSESKSGSESEKSESSEGSLGWEIDHAWDESKFSMLPVGVPRATVRTSAISPDTFAAYREEDQFGVGPRGRNFGQDEQWDNDFV